MEQAPHWDGINCPGFIISVTENYNMIDLAQISYARNWDSADVVTWKGLAEDKEI